MSENSLGVLEEQKAVRRKASVEGMMVEKRDGRAVPFDPVKIEYAIENAAIAAGKSQKYVKESINGTVDRIIDDIIQRFQHNDFCPNVENIHDVVEKHLMIGNHYEVAKAYILFRADRRRTEQEQRKKVTFLKKLTVQKTNGSKVLFNPQKVKTTIQRHSKGLKVDQEIVFEEAVKNIYSGIKSEEIERALILAATSFIEIEPDYNVLSSRLFLQKLKKEAFGHSSEDGSKDAEDDYRQSFIDSIRVGVEAGTLDSRMLDYDLESLSQKLNLNRDHLFKYIGLSTLYERYFIQFDGRRLETPQTFFMRVAMGLALNEEKKEKWAVKFYDVMSEMLYMPSTPTLFHSGLSHPQLSSCYLTTVGDDLESIFQSFNDNAQLSKWSGGLGNDWTPIRSTGASIKSTGVDSQGVIPFQHIANATTIAISRSGKRRGATCAYLEVWHSDIFDFIDLRRNTGDFRRRTHDMNIAAWIPDLFMERVEKNEKWTLFSPDEVPDLHELYGEDFRKAYTAYERKAKRGKIKNFQVIKAVQLYRKIIERLFETGHPWLTWKDACNVRSPQDHVGVVHSSNLCVTGDQRVVSDKGLLTAKELYEQGENLRLFDNQKLVNSTQMQLIEENAEVFKITLDNGMLHTVTKYHKLLTSNGVKECQKLTDDDRVAVQTNKGLFGSKYMPDEAFLLGLYQSDGTQHGDLIMLDVWENDFDLCEEIQEKFDAIHYKYECDSYEIHHPLGHSITRNREPAQFHECNTGCSLVKKKRLSAKTLKKALDFSKGSVPQWIWESDEDTQWQYIKGLLIADGSVFVSKSLGNPLQLYYADVNKEFLNQLQIVFANLGLQTSIRLIREGGRRLLPDGKGGQKFYDTKDCWRLIVGNKNDALTIEEKTGFLSRKGVELEDREYRDNTKKFYKINKIEPAGRENVYCCTVDSDEHLWVCNGIVTHNCTEITLNTSPSETISDTVDENGIRHRETNLGEVAVCNLGSVVLPNHITKTGKIDKDRLHRTITLAMRMLDNVIDLNFYPIPEAKNSNFKHRPVGLGIMGLQDALFKAGVNYEDSDDFGDELQELISYNAISASSDLAKERGAYTSFEGSKWHRGIFPLDTIRLLEDQRGEKIDVSRKSRLDWKELKNKVQDQGMRNSNTMAVAPTATISSIVGCLGPCGEPLFKNIFVKANMTGEFTIVNEYLIEDLKKLKMWSRDMLDQIKFHDGSVQSIEVIPQELKDKYKEAFEINPFRAVDLTALRGKWIDQSQSHNVFIRGKSGKLLSELYMYAWKKGLKTTYYLRSLGASQIEKSTLDANKFGFTQKRDYDSNNGNGKVKACSLADPDCEACQ